MEFLIINAEFGLKTKLVPVVFCFVLLFKVSLKLILLYFPNFWYINVFVSYSNTQPVRGGKNTLSKYPVEMWEYHRSTADDAL